MAIELHKNIVVEPVGDDLLVCDLKGSTVAMLSGSHADVVRAVSAGDEVPASLTHLLDELITRGVLRDTRASSLFSRRKALGLAAGAAGAGFLTLAMPQVALAASGCVFAPTNVDVSKNNVNGGEDWDIKVDLGDNPCEFTEVELSYGNAPFSKEESETTDGIVEFSLVDEDKFPVYIRGVLPGGGTSNVVAVPLPSDG